MASNIYLVRQRISRLGQVGPGEAPPLPSPSPPLASRGRLSSVSASAPPPAAQPPPPRPVASRARLPEPAPPALPRRPAPRSCWSPLLLRPAVLSLSPSFPQRMSSFQLNLNPLKEPLGFIKVLEWIASIFAFATCGGFKGKTEIQLTCHKGNENKTITAAFAYPFRLNEASFDAIPNANVCDINWKNYVLIGDYSSSAQFYVTFAVFVFLYCLAALLLYVGYTNLYRESRKLPMIECKWTSLLLLLPLFCGW
uniref:Synaptophysin like 1 n=1 Tax=Felis catus TaxID=9685 RepID=A0ABI7XC30_FELCA